MEKKSKQRQAILEVLQGTKSHPTADWIYDEVRKVIPNISLGTVYRNLKLLSERGEIMEVNMDGSTSRYDACTDEHCHFRCGQCGRVFDVKEPLTEKLDRKVEQLTGFVVTRHQFEFHGLCTNCQ
jgi:Fur family peroxide stress response transcriptional regulator